MSGVEPGASTDAPLNHYDLLKTVENAYELTAGGETTAFAANLLDGAESTIAPQDKLLVGAKEAGAVEGFHAGVRREIWIYLLLAAALLSAIEWATYHRRVTV